MPRTREPTAYLLPSYPKPHIRRSQGAWSVRTIRGSIFYFSTLATMGERWGYVSPYHEGNCASDLSDRLHPDLPEARAL